MATWNNERVRDLVIRTIIGEAARDNPASMVSVAHVLKNRADSGQYGDRTISGLTNTIRAPKQFSMWNSDISSSGKTISSSDPYYQRAGVIADAVFGGQIPDNTGGADHYYAPGGMPGGRAPSWAIGQTPTATIGGQHFYKLGLSAGDATNFGHTSEPAIGSVSSAPLSELGHDKGEGQQAVNSALANAKSMLGKNEVPNHDEIQKYLHDGGQDLDPHKLAWCAAFVSASLQKAGLPVPTQVVKDSKTGAGAYAPNYLTYGKGVDDPNSVQAGDILVAKDGSHVGFAEGPVRQGANGPEVQLIAGNEKDTSGQYTPGSYTNPDTGAVANRAQVGQVGERWVPLANYAVRRAVPADSQTATSYPNGVQQVAPSSKGGIGSDANIPLGTAPAGTPPAVSTIVPNPNVPAANAQPVSATAPTSAAAPAAAPGSDKYSVLQGMTSGTGRNPMLYTAANFGNLFGGAAPSPPPAAAPAATTATSPQPASVPDTVQRVPLANTPLPPLRPTDAASVAAPIDTNHPLPWQAPQQGPPAPTPWEKATTDQNNPMPWPAAGPGHVPNWGPWHGGGSATNPIIDAPPSTLLPPTVIPNQGANIPNNPNTLPNTGGVPGGGVTGRAPMTQGAPSMGFPAQTNPFGAQGVAQLPGSMFASAQNLIKMLFPSNVG